MGSRVLSLAIEFQIGGNKNCIKIKMKILVN